MKLTANMLTELGACSSGVRAFRDKFPTRQFPDGVEVDEATCGKYYRWTNLTWMLDNLLSGAGQRFYYERINTLSESDRTHGTGDARRARLIGHIFDTMPQYRNPRVEQSVDAAERRADDNALGAVRHARRNLQHARDTIKQLTTNLPTLEERVVTAEAAAVDAQRRSDERRLVEVKRQLESVAAQRQEREQLYQAQLAELSERELVLTAQLLDATAANTDTTTSTTTSTEEVTTT